VTQVTVETRLNAVERDLAGVAAEQHAQRQSLTSIESKLDNIIAARGEEGRPNYAVWAGFAGIMLTMMGMVGAVAAFAIKPLYSHMRDGHPVRVESLVGAESKRVDKIESELDKHKHQGAHTNAAERMSNLEARMSEAEKNIEDIDKFGSRNWAHGE